MTHPASPLHRERLWPAPWIFVATALVIPASLLVFLPISLLAGALVGGVLYAAILTVLLLTTPTIEVDATELRAGHARLPLSVVARTSAVTGEEAVAERGTRLDARAWLLLRGWVPGLVRVDLDDPDDPTPYWLISSRDPERLASAILRAR